MPNYIIKRNENLDLHKNCTQMFTAVLFIMTKNRKQPKCAQTEEWTNNMRYIHKMKYYSTIKRKKVMIHATTWMKFENVTLNEKASQRMAYGITLCT